MRGRLAVLLLLHLSSHYLIAQGDGSDGALSVTGTTNFDSGIGAPAGYLIAPGMPHALNTAGSTTLYISNPTGFAATDRIVIMQMIGTSVGQYEVRKISSVNFDGANWYFTLTSGLTYSYYVTWPTDMVQYVRVPEYTNVTVSGTGTLTCSAYNNITGGLIYFYANGTVTVNSGGYIDVSAKGFSGGAAGAAGSGGAGGAAGAEGNGSFPSCGFCTAGSPGGSSGTGGGGGNGSNGGGAGGAGASTGSAGTSGSAGATGSGSGGAAYTAAATNNSNSSNWTAVTGGTSLIMGGGGGSAPGTDGTAGAGGGGGGGGSDGGACGTCGGVAGNSGANGANGGAGGNGGGIIVVYATNLTGSGNIWAKGGAGSAGNNGNNGGAGGAGGTGGVGFSTGGDATRRPGGGGGGGNGANGSNGSNGGGGGAGGSIWLAITGSNTFSGTISRTAGAGGAAAASGGSVGAGGAGGTAGSGAFATDGTAGSSGTTAGTGGTTSGTSGSTGINISSTPLPINMINFYGRNEGDINVLFWNTATEVNNDKFEIERTIDGMNFVKIAQVKGAGNSSVTLSYFIIDEQPEFPVSYYRIKQTDFDGDYEYSPIISITKNNNNNAFIVHPNPTTNETALRYNSFSEQPAILKVFNADGQVVYDDTFTAHQGTNEYVLKLNNYASGLYSVNLILNGKVNTCKLMKQ